MSIANDTAIIGSHHLELGKGPFHFKWSHASKYAACVISPRPLYPSRLAALAATAWMNPNDIRKRHGLPRSMAASPSVMYDEAAPSVK
jgi:hypothetical protein